MLLMFRCFNPWSRRNLFYSNSLKNFIFKYSLISTLNYQTIIQSCATTQCSSITLSSGGYNIQNYCCSSDYCNQQQPNTTTASSTMCYLGNNLENGTYSSTIQCRGQCMVSKSLFFCFFFYLLL